MPGRRPSRASQTSGPKPFSSEWLATDEPVEPMREPFRFPAWIPDGRTLSAAMVVLVAFATALITFRGSHGISIEDPKNPAPTAVATLEALAAAGEPTAEPTLAPTQAPPPAAAQTPDPPMSPASATMEFGQVPSIASDDVLSVARAPLDVALLPEYRIVTYYGHPHDPNMGIVGEISMEDLADAVRAEAANYAAADPTRPVIPAFELIATVAQRVPGSDGTFILDTDHDTLKKYIDYADEQGMIVLLDLQIGRGTVADEIEKVRDLLARPNVHLALDPEFAVAEGEIPGEYIGSLPAESIVYAQQVLADLSVQHGIPPKLLVVHQFREDMIQDKETLGPMPGVQLVIDADGYGAPELKTAVYNFLVRDEPVEFAGVKIFYRQDVPVMTPKEILALVPSPDVIIYQ